MPNGYKFFPIFRPGDPALPQVATLSPEILIDSRNHIVFSANDASELEGLYQLTIDYGGSIPRVVDQRTIIQCGTTRPDGRLVDSVVSVDVSDSGLLAAVVNYDTSDNPTDLGPCSVLLDRGQGLESLLEYDQDLPGNQGTYGGDFSDIDIVGDNVTVVGRYGIGEDIAQGVFYLPHAAPDQCRILVNSGQEVPNAEGNIDSIGLIDLDDEGDYVVQAFGSDPMLTKAGGAGGRGSFILKGHVDRPSASGKLVAACKSLTLTRAARGDAQPSIGNSYYGPRIAAHDLTSHITEDASGNVTLYRNNVPIAVNGQPSPAGSLIRGAVSAVFNRSGLMFYELITDAGLELCVHNGSTAATLLSRGDKIDGIPVDTLALGCHTAQADDSGRIVCYAQMKNGQEVILLGIPV